MDDHEACYRWLKAHARKFNLELNAEYTAVMRVVCGLLKNKKKYGHYYCPCKVVTGDEELDKYNECPCRDHERDIAKNGMCHCRLFVRR